MATDPNGLIEDPVIEGQGDTGSNEQDDHDLNPNRSNNGNSGSPPTTPEIEPGKIPGIDSDPDPGIEPEIEPGKIPDDTLIPQK